MSAPVVPRPAVPPAHSVGGHLRAVGVFLALAVLVTGFAYPALVTGIAAVIDPGAANGSLLYYANNGTVAGSSLVAQNTDAPYLFWERPSLTDYNLTLGAASPPGPSDPALRALLNETIAYMQKYGIMTVNATVPYWYAAPSASSVDPDLVPEAVLVQIPRVANATNLSIGYLQSFVNSHIVTPVVPYIGEAFVNVLELDLALLPIIGK